MKQWIINLQINNTGDRRLEEFTSSGLYGIESDCGDDYLEEVGIDELEGLRFHLEVFGIDTSDWDNITKNVKPKEYV